MPDCNVCYIAMMTIFLNSEQTGVHVLLCGANRVGRVSALIMPFWAFWNLCFGI